MSSRNDDFLLMIKKYDCSPRIIIDNLTEDDAFLIEHLIIEMYRMFSDYPLCNKVPGGRNPIHSFSGSPYQTAAFRKKMSDVVSGNKNPNYAHYWSEEQKIAASIRQKESKRYVYEKNPKSKSIMCVETGEIFPCIQYAMEKYQVKYPASFTIAIDNPTRTAGKMHWVTYNNRT